MGGVILLHFHDFISLEAVKHPEKIGLLIIPSGNVNVSGFVTCQYPQTY